MSFLNEKLTLAGFFISKDFMLIHIMSTGCLCTDIPLQCTHALALMHLKYPKHALKKRFININIYTRT